MLPAGENIIGLFSTGKGEGSFMDTVSFAGSPNVKLNPSCDIIVADIKIMKNAENARNFSQCDSILIGDKCGAHTFPYIDVKNPTAKMEHEATTSSIGEDQLFYCNQRGINLDDAVSMIVNGFCKEVFAELPMEFAVEAKQLIEVTLENSVG